MKTLNLVYPEKSDIKYEISKFPDGQQDVIIEYNNIKEAAKSVINNVGIGVTIISRFNSFKDLEIILCATKALKRLGVTEISLYIPYLLGARSDRKFKDGGTSYLRDIIAPILNAQKYKVINCLDIHNVAVADACINNLRAVSNDMLVTWAIRESRLNNSEMLLVSPDEGASKKIFSSVDTINYTGMVITCSKTRINGKLANCFVPLDMSMNAKHFVIIDDICDGGGTFINIANEIKKVFSKAKISLIVTHGIFSRGFECLNIFENIYTTNSVKDLEFGEETNIKQLNVFQ